MYPLLYFFSCIYIDRRRINTWINHVEISCVQDAQPVQSTEPISPEPEDWESQTDRLADHQYCAQSGGIFILHTYCFATRPPDYPIIRDLLNQKVVEAVVARIGVRIQTQVLTVTSQALYRSAIPLSV